MPPQVGSGWRNRRGLLRGGAASATTTRPPLRRNKLDAHDAELRGRVADGTRARLARHGSLDDPTSRQHHLHLPHLSVERFVPIRRWLIRHHFVRTGTPWRSVRAWDKFPVGDEIGELVQDEPGIRDRPGIPGMTRKRKPIRGLQPQASPKRTMKDPDLPPLRSPPQARTRLAEWPLTADQTPDDQAAQVQMAPRLATARAPIEDRGPAPRR